MRIESCRSCDSDRLEVFLELGRMPHSDGLLRADDLSMPEAKYPLDVAYCTECSLVQIMDTVPPEELFQRDYPYYSSFSDALLKHTGLHVDRSIAERGLGPESLVVELASNDGYLLQYYHQAGIPVLGIDPAIGPVEAARAKGVESICDFFGEGLARELVAQGHSASVIHGNNVLAHVPDLRGFVSGVATLLAPDGQAVFEFPYVKDLIDHVEFDTIYHQHLCYFSLSALIPIFGRVGLGIERVERIPIHGGSLRLTVGRSGTADPSVAELLARERAEGLDTLDYYRDFSQSVVKLKTDLCALLDGLKSSGKSIAAYGAAAKGAILTNYVDIGRETLAWCADRNNHKHGRFMPGTHVEVVSAERVLEDQPDYLLILPWNFKDEIIEQQQEFARRGGRFIVPVPTPQVV